MKVFVDEDAGSGLGVALAAVRVQATYVARKQSIKPGTADEIWMPLAARQGRLVLSRNVNILLNDAQRTLLIDEKLGFVFLPQLSPLKLLTLVLRHWEKLEKLDAEESRPFAYWLGVSGQLRKLPLDGSRTALRRKIGGLPPRRRVPKPAAPSLGKPSRRRQPRLPAL